MAFFTGLITITLLIMLVTRLAGIRAFQGFWEAGRLAAAVMFIQVGIMHLTRPEDLVYMIEGFMPYPTEIIILTGVTEIVLPLAVMAAHPQTGRMAADGPACGHVSGQYLCGSDGAAGARRPAGQPLVHLEQASFPAGVYLVDLEMRCSKPESIIC
jgi:hypothetical protein